MNIKKIIVALFALGMTATQAVGPKIPYRLTWTPSPSPDVTGYFLYWRTGTQTYMDTQRIGIATNAAPFDLRVLNLQKGDYYISMSATNATSESPLSVECLWHYSTPYQPSQVFVQ